jgi:carbamoyl-phosphate synthase large subunit
MKDSKINVLVTGVGGGGVGHQILKALLMAKTPYRLVVADLSSTAYGLFVTERNYLIPPASDPDYIEFLIKICRKENVQVLIPGSEPEILKVSRDIEEFSEMGVTALVNPVEVVETCLDKLKTIQFLKSNGFNYPKTILVEGETDLSEVDFYPVIIKPATNSGGSRNVFLAQTKGELAFFVNYLVKQGCLPLVQEYVGTFNDEYTVGVMALRSGEIVNSIALKRYITSGLSKKIQVKSYTTGEDLIVSSGISQGEVGDFSEICEYAELIAKRLGASGSINIQGRNTDKGFCTFEINPRFSGTTSVRALLGYNEPDLLIRNRLFGEKIPRIEFRKGVVVRGLSELYIPFSQKNELEGRKGSF